jgi:protein-L-isoaspartate(D-aspartate) O-methyltransferase
LANIVDMMDVTIARRAMVDQQIATAGVTDARLLSAFRHVPREPFLPEDRQSLAYSDAHHALGNGRFLPAPAVFARMAQLARIAPDDRVLDYWPGAGYSSAILAFIAREVVALEPDPAFAAVARANLDAVNMAQVRVISGDVHALDINTFDVILVEGAVAEAPTDLIGKLAMGGRLVCLVRRGPVGVATLHLKTTRGVETQTAFNATLPLLQRQPATENFVF